MVDTIKFSEMTDGGDIDNNKKVPGLKDGGNVLFNNPWTFLPPGTTAERPTPSAEINYRLRFNTDEQLYEYYDATLGAWTQLQESLFTAGPFIIYEADPSIPDAQNLGALADGILKQTIVAGVATLDIAIPGTDYYGPGDNATFSGITMTGNIDMGGFKATNAADPTNPQDYATKFYVDQTALSGKSVYAATTTNLLVTQSGSGVGATLTDASGTFAPLTLDGEAVPLGDDFLVKDLISPENEGIYTLTTNGDGISIPWQGTRSINYDTPSQINSTGLIVVRNGTTLGGTTWYNADTIVTVDTTPFDYVQFGSSYVESVTGTANQIDVDNTDPQNPILSLSATLDAPGTFTIQGTVALDAIIDDDTFATATDSNVPTAESVKAYVDNLVNVPSPTKQTFITGSGTYTTPAGVKWLRVRMVGAGAGGQGNSSNGNIVTTATVGGNTTFGGATAGGGQISTTVNYNSASGGTFSGSITGALSTNAITGGKSGGGSQNNSTANVNQLAGGSGGASAFGGGGGGALNTTGTAAAAYGAGGGGGGTTTNAGYVSGAGGGAGAYGEAIVATPSASYAYAVGAAGAGGVGANFNGGNGAGGLIIVEEFYI